MSVTPFAWKDRPSLIERVLPVQKISAEAQKERKAGAGQTLTSLGSYWKGRKPLILVKACILGALLPASDDSEMDLAVFEKLMAIDDLAFMKRVKSAAGRERISTLPYLERLGLSNRPEEIDEAFLYKDIWDSVNAHLGTNASSVRELVEQMGVLRFGHRPIVGDTFCGGGSIPFEAARLGCDVCASDLNPIACMLTWGALNIIGADERVRAGLEDAQRAVAEEVDREISTLAIEHDANGNRAKAFLYCLETRCPQTGWLVPMSPSWVLSKTRNVIARLTPIPEEKRFQIDILSNVSAEEMTAASTGTVQDGDLVYALKGEIYRTPIKTIRGDYRMADGTTGNRLRRWEKSDFIPRADDVFQERLYCIQWITRATIGKGRQETFFAAVTEEDLEREKVVEDIVRSNLSQWQEQGLVPEMEIEPGAKTDEPIRTRGWTQWNHLFLPRELLLFSKLHSESITNPKLMIQFAKALDRGSRLCRWTPGSPGRPGVALTSEKVGQVFDNQAFNTQYNYAQRSAFEMLAYLNRYETRYYPITSKHIVKSAESSQVDFEADIFVSDPPYADAVCYDEITEFFIAWLRRDPPAPFNDWVWDSRRALAVKGAGEDFRRKMIDAYQAMSDQMPDHGIQVVMFTHQDASVWADMTAIVWGAGLQVTAAWYIATETTSELKKGGYVQGTVLLILRKRLKNESVYRDELVEEVRQEVARQLETMVGLNQTGKAHGRSENLFEDADLQMAGYAAALRVLTGYSRIDGQEMAAEALRPRQKEDRDIVKEIIDFAVQVANEHLVPEGLAPSVWERCSGAERFYLKMVEMEGVGLKKLDNYQNFAKAFRVEDYGALMGSVKPNDARLKRSLDLKKSEFDGEFGKSALRSVLFGLYELQREIEIDEVMAHLRDLVPGYMTRRGDLMAFCQYLGEKREIWVPEEAQAARILFARIKNERLGE